MGKAALVSYILVKQSSPVLIVGQAPAKNDHPSNPISGRTGRKLAMLMDLTFEEFLDTFDRANLLSRYPGKDGKGDAFNPHAAERNARLLLSENQIDRYRHILVLGKNVAKAFGYRTDEYMKWQTFSRPFTAILPHPSGINRWWNDKRNHEAAKQFLLELL